MSANLFWVVVLLMVASAAGGLTWYLYESWRAVTAALVVTFALVALASYTLHAGGGHDGSGPPSGVTNRP